MWTGTKFNQGRPEKSEMRPQLGIETALGWELRVGESFGRLEVITVQDIDEEEQF